MYCARIKLFSLRKWFEPVRESIPHISLQRECCQSYVTDYANCFFKILPFVQSQPIQTCKRKYSSSSKPVCSATAKDS